MLPRTQAATTIVCRTMNRQLPRKAVTRSATRSPDDASSMRIRLTGWRLGMAVGSFTLLATADSMARRESSGVASRAGPSRDGALRRRVDLGRLDLRCQHRDRYLLRRDPRRGELAMDRAVESDEEQ